MKRFLQIAVFGLSLQGLAMQAQPYGGRPPYADSRYPRYDGHFAERIERGQRAGLITRREADSLWSKERHLRRETEIAYRTGRGISPREADRLERMRFDLDREITRLMRNRENYRGGYPR